MVFGASDSILGGGVGRVYSVITNGDKVLARVQQKGIETVRIQRSLFPLFLSFPLDFFSLSSLFTSARSYLRYCIFFENLGW